MPGWEIDRDAEFVRSSACRITKQRVTRDAARDDKCSRSQLPCLSLGRIDELTDYAF
jgi:hypothetical protein